MMGKITRALIIDKPWIDFILWGIKPWEMRSRPTKIRGRVGLIKKGTGLVVGECEIVNCLGQQSKDDMYGNFLLHRIPDEIHSKNNFKWKYPWVLAGIKEYEDPIPYKHPKGAVIWVDVSEVMR